ncbi:MAG TPA: hypothetical protein VF551_01850, partial [Chthoniobacterales bacterium]
ALTLLESKQEGGQAISDWKVEWEKKIVRHQDFTIADGKPVVSAGKAPVDRATVKLQPNALQKDARATAELVAAFDGNGSFLQTADGLPLISISETRNLKRVVLSARTDNSLDVFQDDEAVVEQFRVTNLDQMMAFDAGEIELK